MRAWSALGGEDEDEDEAESSDDTRSPVTRTHPHSHRGTAETPSDCSLYLYTQASPISTRKGGRSAGVTRDTGLLRMRLSSDSRYRSAWWVHRGFVCDARMLGCVLRTALLLVWAYAGWRRAV
ncbi:hypothetical protein RTBOTA2_005359 [Rhodotorula toruloides]|nr:hypothetical protein RTBOTA2_005359 [Rhodotorula toruloides]